MHGCKWSKCLFNRNVKCRYCEFFLGLVKFKMKGFVSRFEILNMPH